MAMKQNLIKIFSILVLLTIFLNPLLTNASNTDKYNTLSSVIGQASKEYNTEVVNKSHDKNVIQLNEFIISSDYVVLKNNAHFEFVDAIGITDTYYLNLTNDAIWKSNNSNIVTVHNGRILAEGSGSTYVTVEYGNFSHKIDVIVLNENDISQTIDILNKNTSLWSYDRLATDGYMPFTIK